jgi:ABC-type nitrate/sulfonate/bicarbonate transport system permease component
VTTLNASRAGAAFGLRRTAGSAAALGTIGSLLFVALLEFLPRWGVVDRRFLPPLSEMLGALRDQLSTEVFWSALGATLRGWGTGLALAAGAAIVVGMVVGSSSVLRQVTASTVEFLRPIPSVALIPLAVLLYGNQMRATLILVVYASFWQMLVQVLSGTRDVDPVAADTARSYRFGRLRRVRSVLWPTALPYVMTGFRLAAAVALVLEVTGELIIGSPGLGKLIATAQTSGAVATMYAIVIVAGTLGVILNLLARSVERRALRWHPSVRGEVSV